MSDDSKPPTDSELTDLATRLVLSMMRSASTDKIRPQDWWDRAKTALETSASVAEGFPQMVSRFAAKIQVEGSLSESTCKAISSLGETFQGFGREETWERFRRLCERDAVYIVAIARATRQTERQEYEDQRKHGATYPSGWTDDPEIGQGGKTP